MKFNETRRVQTEQFGGPIEGRYRPAVHGTSSKSDFAPVLPPKTSESPIPPLFMNIDISKYQGFVVHSSDPDDALDIPSPIPPLQIPLSPYPVHIERRQDFCSFPPPLDPPMPLPKIKLQGLTLPPEPKDSPEPGRKSVKIFDEPTNHSSPQKKGLSQILPGSNSKDSPKSERKENRMSIKGQIRRSTSLNDVVRASVSKRALDKTDPRYQVELPKPPKPPKKVKKSDKRHEDIKHHLVYVRDEPARRQLDYYGVCPESLKPLLTFLLRQDLVLVKAICGVAPKVAIDSLSLSLVHLFETGGRSMELLTFMIEYEFGVCTVANTLFRDNTIASKSLSAYNKMITVSYLRKTLRPLVYSLFYSDCSFELEQSKLGPGESLEENVKNVTAVVQMFMVKIFRSIETYPLSCRFICHQIMSKARKNFPHETHLPYSLAGTFFFLRFICPAIVFPDKNGVWELEVPQKTRRALTIISKILQRLTVRESSVNIKEALMVPMKDFFAEQSEKGTMKMFFDLMGTPPNLDEIREELTLVQPDPHHISNMWDHIRPLQEKIEAQLMKQSNGHAEQAANKKECDIVYNVGLGLMLPPK
uniref:Ras-GAP domain-containing protein n=1 Tax=Paramoeba aestuarina TaxID=180227 RepID=A0A7S4N4R9_9EUKA|mmetsp:Transcript_10833/g.16333  ORF Transcript_10833/g.16333 Transcript_10833/m.16333 type:complete len:588 (+) Transcript_10833:85-1848(+)|eukprot:CAMPEP_0201510336 /NCGR_PEP_ID=MMETSP0161_2-20130828/3065_1 /ASSEMBLY_ACC=CAM_ASM_000251 /TAXON_ID=180227 /ORGANISM="Neoparamoeba aestuarina, Strain SoJaBio B1-5/56/2" /LENGTH=587 /DNA_ID=CAMNT_0047905489 /DNA_START=113 /DNA_END=1876 /DNA_ORIENTATION=-